MRYHVKGGTWKNAEDEILKAAVMKYGLNQWSRVSSLLVRKSAKQCKERWYNWLDPKIKKTDWTKKESEQLLTLSKMFPSQWKTIATFIGRTPYQCVQHFQEVIDKAEGLEIDPNNDPRKLKVGEIDPNPESKPARPDPIDLDEDMKETLNEARARVANTRGKKAKRKIREKQLEEAKRLATLQRKRELKSAGIELNVSIPKRLKKETNYNKDIPFMREVPKGTWTKPEGEDDETPEPDKFKANINLQYLEGRSRDIMEEKQKKKDEMKMKSLKLKNLPLAFELINRKYDFNDDKRENINLEEPVNKDEEDQKVIDNNKGNFDEEENEEDYENFEKGIASFDFLKMDIFKTDINRDNKKEEEKNNGDDDNLKNTVKKKVKIKKGKNDERNTLLKKKRIKTEDNSV